MVTESWRSHPAVQRMARVARALGHLSEELVFIGGAVAPLLQTRPPFARARPTRDVDATTASRSYRDMERLHQQLAAAGFRQDPSAPGHLHRWVSPAGDWLDLVPAGDHPGGSGQRWGRLAIETSEHTDLGEGIVIRHASAPGWLALKWAAYLDRGRDDPYGSHDLEDFLALIASRPSLGEEVGAGSAELAQWIAGAANTLLRMPEIEDLLADHLNNAQDPAQVRVQVKERLRALAVT